MSTCGNRSFLILGIAKLCVQGVAWLSILLLINIIIISWLLMVGNVGICETAIMTAPVNYDELS